MPEPEIMLDAEKPIIQKITNRVKSIQKARQQYEKQWLTNIAFLYGKHYFKIKKGPFSGLEERIQWELSALERRKKVRRIANYILPLYRSLLARMLLMKANISVEPLTRGSRDVEGCKVAQEVLEDFWQNVNKTNSILCQDYAGMLGILQRLFSYILTVGRGWLKPYFNPNSSAKVFMGEEVQEFEVGQVETEVDHVFNVFPDPMNKFLIQQKVLSVEDIESQFNVKVKPEDIGMTDVERQLMNLLEGGKEEKYEDSCRVYEQWELPTKKNPNGKFILTTEKKLILNEIIPEEYKKRIPFFRFDYLGIMMSPHPQGMVDQLIDPQEDYNYTITRLHAYKKWFAGKLKVPKNAKLETKYDDEIGQIIYYQQGFEPHFDTPLSPPSFLLTEINRIRRDMEDISATHDISMSRVPKGVKSRVAIESLSELDNSQLSPVLINVEQQLGFFSEMVLDIMEKKYPEERLLSITGETMGAEVKTFTGEKIKGSRRIKISLGSALPVSKAARQNMILTLKKEGMITPEKALEMMEFGDIEGIYHSIDKTAAKSENQEMAKGNAPEVSDWEDHTIHIKIHADHMKSEQFKKLPKDFKQIFIEHRKAHQEFLRMEMQMAQGGQGGQGNQGVV